MPLNTSSSDTFENRWYDLFSRGTRDWLRHNEKVRQAAREALPNLIAGSDVLSRPSDRSVRVPVKFMEHARFCLRDPDQQSGAGQGEVKPGDVLRRGRPGSGRGTGAGGEGEGGLRFMLEFQVDDILDWLWEELQLPNLQPRPGTTTEDDEIERAGWDRRGARSRLDRRRTVREAVKRRHIEGESATPFSNDDLRFRQLVRRKRRSTKAVIFFLLDVSSSVDDECRHRAKTFFFWALQGIRRQFSQIEAVFIAHTTAAWEFEENEFFRVRGEGGTRSSSALTKAEEILQQRYQPEQYNCYLFYATDGENFIEDREPAGESLARLAAEMNFMGYTEVRERRRGAGRTEVTGLFETLIASGASAATYALGSETDIWPAIREFFSDQAQRQEAGA